MNRIPCRHLAVFFLLFIQSFLFAQHDFNHYTTLLSKGPVPEDFTLPVKEKVKNDLATRETDLTPTKERIFVEGIHRNIDQVLQSGIVVYGDDITAYVNAVAQNLLHDEPQLRSILRFYTIKSNETNALSTDQGIVFVTTGLIAQLTSEAQLAYVLSHEIAHFTEKHVIETYEWKSKNRYAYDRISKLSSHSQEHELMADKLALKLYHGAGYDDDQVISTFDVLMYSYLPFDEVQLPDSYFSNGPMYIPDQYFASKEYPIKTDEDYDDGRSSHPNIRKRKEAALKEMAHYDNWGTIVHTQGESQFIYVRNLARFESVRTHILNGNYADALYAVFLLEKEFPQSVYLQQMKARAWLGLAQLKADGELIETLPKPSEYEGESAALYFFLRKLNDDGMLTMAMRTIYDARKQFPEDSILILIEDRLVRRLAKTDDFEWSDYSTRSFREVSSQANVKDTATVAETETAPKSKYDKIKTKKNMDAPESFDSSKFYAYAIPDILADSAYRKKYTNYRAAEQERKEREKELAAAAATTVKQKGKVSGTAPESGPERVVVVEPGFSGIKKGQPLWAMKDLNEQMMEQAIDAIAKKQGIEQVKIGRSTFAADAETYNQRSLLYALIQQTSVNPDAELVPVDYDLLRGIETATGSSTVLYTAANYAYDSQVNGIVIVVGTLFWPVIPLTYFVYLPIALKRSHELETNVVVMNITTGELYAVGHDYRYGKPSKARYTKIFTPTLTRLASPQ